MSLIDPAVLQAALELCPGLRPDSDSPASPPGDQAPALHEEGRFLTTVQVAEELAATEDEVVGLITGGELAALRLGAPGSWRVERVELEAFISRAYDRTAREVEGRSAAVSSLTPSRALS